MGHPAKEAGDSIFEMGAEEVHATFRVPAFSKVRDS